jgi:hypothetical protein
MAHANPVEAGLAVTLEGLTRQLLVWAAAKPRTYAEAMESWSSWCPKLSIWEDALEAGLIQVVPAPGQGRAAAAVQLTARGRAALRT